jgi:hypothetical protein
MHLPSGKGYSQKLRCRNVHKRSVRDPRMASAARTRRAGAAHLVAVHEGAGTRISSASHECVLYLSSKGMLRSLPQRSTRSNGTRPRARIAMFHLRILRILRWQGGTRCPPNRPGGTQVSPEPSKEKESTKEKEEVGRAFRRSNPEVVPIARRRRTSAQPTNTSRDARQVEPLQDRGDKPRFGSRSGSAT